MKNDIYNLERFIEEQNRPGYGSYAQALSEMKRGRKRGHWIWYIFPQIAGLAGRYGSFMSDSYSISCLEEAKAYMKNEILRERLLEITEVVAGQEEKDPYRLMGSTIDVKKLRSSMTLFAIASPECPVFQKVLDKYYQGIPDQKTLNILNLGNYSKP